MVVIKIKNGTAFTERDPLRELSLRRHRVWFSAFAIFVVFAGIRPGPGNQRGSTSNYTAERGAAAAAARFYSE